jgi:hypothetical protein
MERSDKPVRQAGDEKNKVSNPPLSVRLDPKNSG